MKCIECGSVDVSLGSADHPEPICTECGSVNIQDPLPIIAFGHQSRVGKDTAANAVWQYLQSEGIFSIKTAFAWKLKKAAHLVFGHYGLEDGPYYELPENEHLRDVPLPRIGKTPVELWIEFGNSVRGIYARTWIDGTLDAAGTDRVLVISDLRFQNEGEAIRELGGKCVKVTRPGNPVKGSDQMMAEDFPWDVTIENTSDRATLEGDAIGAARSLLELD